MSDVWTPQPQSSDEWLNGLLASPQYQYGGTPTSLTQQQLLSWYKSVSDATGVPFLELIGGNVGQTQVQPSLQKQVYGNNPIVRDMIAYMDAGDDPMVAFNKVKKNQEDNKAYGDSVDFNDEDTSAKFFKIAEDYKYEMAKNQSDAAGTYTTVSGKKYQGAGDIFSEKSMYELMGSPDVATMKNKIASLSPSVKGKVIPKSEGGWATYGEGPGGTQHVNEKATVGGTVNPNFDPHLANALEFVAKKRLEDSKSRMVQSDAQQEFVRKVLALKALTNPIPIGY